MSHSTPPPSSLPQSNHRRDQHRKAKPLPIQLLDHCTVCIEEQLYSQGLSLLSNALTAGTGSDLEAYIPPTQHLALAGTLIVHPQLTTRATSPDKQAAANDALTYLRYVNSLLRPKQSGLDKAFQFNDGVASARGKRARTRVSDMTSDDEDDKPGNIRSPYTGKESLWTNADDLWSVVGWAFNCSVAHRHRWERWKLWLDLMIETLQDDLENRLPEAEKMYQATGSTTVVEELLKDSMLAQNLSRIGGTRHDKRRLMRAILANGRSTSLSEFGEVWRNETKAPKQKDVDRSSERRKLDLENGEFGDYFDDSDEESLASSVRRSRSGTAMPSAQQSRAASDGEDVNGDGMNGSRTPNGTLQSVCIDSFGGMESIFLRQRLLGLLTLFCWKNPEAFLDTEDLFDLYTEFLRPLPLPIFQQFVLPAKPWLGPNSQASLNQMLLRPLVVATAPQCNENALTQAEFETHYAPYAANNTSHVNNARVSLLVESLLRLLWSTGSLECTSKLRQLVDDGITARKEKVAFDGRKKVGDRVKVDEEALVVLECSAERMLTILDMVQ